MDRPKKGSTITIKINGDNKAYQDELRKSKESTNPDPNVVEIQPKLIEDKAIMETAAAQEDESFDWIIPESSENVEEEDKAPSSKGKGKGPDKTVSFSSYYKKKNGQPIRSIFITAILAVLIGTTIGVFMLKLLNGEPAEKVATEPKVVKETPDSGKKPVNQPAKTTSATIKQQTVFVIQGGVFGSKEGADVTAKKLASMDVPLQTIKIDDQFYLFIGVADSIETAKSLGVQYKKDGVDAIFAKPLLIDEKNISGLSETEKRFVEAVPTIYQTLSLVTSSALLKNKLPAEGDSALPIIEKHLKTSGVKNKKVTSLKAELQDAEEKVRNFQSSKDAKSLYEAQQHLLNFLSTYYSM